MNRHSMLEMGGRLAVFGATLPAVVADDDILASEIYHGLYGDDHAGLQKRTYAATPVVGNLRILMHALAYAVTAHLPHDTVAWVIRVFPERCVSR